MMVWFWDIVAQLVEAASVYQGDCMWECHSILKDLVNMSTVCQR